MSVTRHPYTHNTSREQKTLSRIISHRISTCQTRHSKTIQPIPTTTYIGIVPYQTDAQKRYLPDIISSVVLNASNGIDKAISTKNSVNWGRWCKFLKHSGISDKFLGGIPQDHRTILVSSFAASVRRNQFGTTRKKFSSR